MGIEVATEGQVAAAASRAMDTPGSTSEAALGFGDACTQIHLLIPPATDCDGVSLLIEWLPPSVDDQLSENDEDDDPDDDEEMLRSGSTGADSWVACSACSPIDAAPIATPSGHRVVLVSGLSPFAFYRFRLRLNVRDDLDKSETLTREGPQRRRFLLAGVLLVRWWRRKSAPSPRPPSF